MRHRNGSLYVRNGMAREDDMIDFLKYLFEAVVYIFLICALIFGITYMIMIATELSGMK